MRILIVKLSSLGDVVHAMPAVQDIGQAFAGRNVQIDWVVEQTFAPLVERCAGVQRVIPCSLRRWRKTPFSAQTRTEWRAFKQVLQQESYDAVLDLQGLSKSALVAWLARTTATGKRYAMDNQTEGSGYEAPTRWVADQAIALEPHVDAVTRSRLLCACALGYALPGGAPRFGLEARQVPAGDSPLAKPKVVLVHGTSRVDKQWPLAHWLALGQRLNRDGFQVLLAYGSAAEEAVSATIAQQLDDALVWPHMGLDAVVDAMAACTAVIGVDSGLSHIAVALGLPHVQIYNFDTAWRTGPLPGSARQCSVFASPAPTVEQVWQAWLGVAKPMGS